MANIFISIFLLISSFELFVGTFQMNGIQRNFYSLNRGVLEQAVVIEPTAIKGEYNVNYDVYKVKEFVVDFLTYTLESYTDNFEVGFHFYFVSSKKTCTLDKCDAVRISLHAPVTLFQSYDNALSFELVKGIQYE